MARATTKDDDGALVGVDPEENAPDATAKANVDPEAVETSSALGISSPTPAATATDIARAPKYSSPMFNPMAMLVGGLGSFLNTCTYTSVAVLGALLLMEPQFGIVANVGAITASEASKVSLTWGAYHDLL